MEENRNSIILIHRRVLLAKITSGELSVMPHITHVAFGNGGVTFDGVDDRGRPIYTEIPPKETQASLNSEVGRYPIAELSFPVDPPTTARYVTTIPLDDLPGESISEAALIDVNGDAHAIKTFLPVNKSPGIGLTFTFDDRF
ncbi:MAG: phage tail protein [Oscillospiraceae bacterium]|nr:phage tail protein [Oscillospiraceae bacterium]